MRKRNSKRLQLRKQAIRQLDPDATRAVRGGTELVSADTACGSCNWSWTSHTGGPELVGDDLYRLDAKKLYY